MKRDSLEDKAARQPLLGKILHECRRCHHIGVKPGVLATNLGDYGMRDWIRGRYEELKLSPDGFCAGCAEVSGTSMPPG